MDSRKLIFQYLNSFNNDNPDFIFLENEEKSYTISEFLNTICSTANFLYSKGVRKNDVVAILALKDIETIIYFFSCQMLGAIALMYDIHQELDTLKAETGVNVKYNIGLEREVIKKNHFPMLMYDVWYDSKDTTILIPTSGSTGKRKLVELSQYAFINNAVDSTNYGGYSTSDIALAFLPLNHVFAIAMLFTAIVFRFKVVVAKSTDIRYLLEAIQKYSITRFNCVPSLLLKMLPFKDEYNLSSLRYAYIGGAPCSQAEFLKIEANLGLKLISVYGMTECVGISTGSSIDNAKILATSVGKPYPLNDVRLSIDGEIMVKSPSLCNGYFNEELMMKDGYLLTGDIGRFDRNGYLHIIGRKKEIIIRNGINISIGEIAKKLSDISSFNDYAVVGIKDNIAGEVPALVVVSDNHDSTTIFTELKKHLNKYEMPNKVLLVDSIPMLDNGKVDKEKIKKMFV